RMLKEKANFLRKKALQGKIRICGLDEAVYKVKEEREIVLLLSGIPSKRTVEVKVIESRKAFTLKKKTRFPFNQPGVEIVVTDDAEKMEVFTLLTLKKLLLFG
ncbi:hypothetical protein H5U35_02580, partial [Candidatus Aerophobetes bacterium]|nr:hypothetical protein [Candidatus Aerophobetes bacterium]